MGPVPVVIVHEDVESSLNVLLVQNQQPVEAFRADGAHEPLGHAIGLRRAKRRADDLNSVTAEHFVKMLGEFLIAIANQKFHGSAHSDKVHDSCRACRMTRGALALGVHATMHTAAPQLNEEEDVESLRPDGLDREEVDGQQALTMRPMNSRHVISLRLPTGPRPAARSHARTVVADTTMPSPFSSPAIRR